MHIVRALSIFLRGIHKSDLHIYTHFQVKKSAFLNTSELRCTRDAIHIVTQEQFEKQKTRKYDIMQNFLLASYP